MLVLSVRLEPLVSRKVGRNRGQIRRNREESINSSRAVATVGQFLPNDDHAAKSSLILYNMRESARGDCMPIRTTPWHHNNFRLQLAETQYIGAVLHGMCCYPSFILAARKYLRMVFLDMPVL